MYPLRDGLNFARNQWYVGAFSNEVTEKPLARTILEERLVFFRSDSGEVAALADTCLHRRYPLSRGKVSGDGIVCGYHGFRFNASGKCTMIPSQDRIPEGFRVRSYPVVEKWNWIWIWMGDPDRVEMSLLPDHDRLYIERDGWYPAVGSYHHLKARYQLLNENLLDLSHLSYIHETSIGTTAIVRAKVEVAETDAGLRVSRLMENDVLPAAFVEMVGCPARADRELTTEYFPPSVHAAGSSLYNPGTRSLYGAFKVIHVATPETSNSTHYFWAFSRTFGHGDESITERFLKMNAVVFAEDIAALEALEQGLSHDASARDDGSAAADAGSLRGRRLLEEMIELDELVRPVDSRIHPVSRN